MSASNICQLPKYEKAIKTITKYVKMRKAEQKKKIEAKRKEIKRLKEERERFKRERILRTCKLCKFYHDAENSWKVKCPFCGKIGCLRCIYARSSRLTKMCNKCYRVIYKSREFKLLLPRLRRLEFSRDQKIGKICNKTDKKINNEIHKISTKLSKKIRKLNRQKTTTKK